MSTCIEKTRMSAFIGTELDLMLRTLGVTTLFVCGIQTPNCIRTTVFDAIAYNYPVVLIDDATGASSEDVHRANVRDMQNIGVRIVKAAEIPGDPGLKNRAKKRLLFPDIVPDQPDTDNDDGKIIDCRNDGHELVGDPGPDQLLDDEIQLECCDQDEDPDDDIR